MPAVFFDGRHYISQHMPDAGNQVTADHKSITINLSSDSCQSDVKSESESDINIIKVVVPIRSSELRYRYDTYRLWT